MKKIIKTALLLVSLNCFSQIQVNGVDLNKDSEIIEVWAFKKPLTTKESLFVDYGQKKFRPHYYDHKTQCIIDKDGNKFKKGSWLSLVKYLKSQGWSKGEERKSTIGDVTGRIIVFEKK